MPQETIQVLDVVLRESPSWKYNSYTDSCFEFCFSNLLSRVLTNFWLNITAVMSQFPDPFSLLLLVTEATLARGLSVGGVTTKACAQHKWGFH